MIGLANDHKHCHNGKLCLVTYSEHFLCIALVKHISCVGYRSPVIVSFYDDQTEYSTYKLAFQRLLISIHVPPVFGKSVACKKIILFQTFFGLLVEISTFELSKPLLISWKR